MSPAAHRLESLPISFPRVSGDEPTMKLLLTDTAVFSPRERG